MLPIIEITKNAHKQKQRVALLLQAIVFIMGLLTLLLVAKHLNRGKSR